MTITNDAMMYMVRSVAWLRILISAPRSVEDDMRLVQLPGLPAIALEHFIDYWRAVDPESLHDATDADGLLRLAPESVWSSYLSSLITKVEEDEDEL